MSAPIFAARDRLDLSVEVANPDVFNLDAVVAKPLEQYNIQGWRIGITGSSDPLHQRKRV